VPPAASERRVGAAQRLADRHGVEDGEPGHDVGMVHREAEGYVGASVVPRDAEAGVPEATHQAPAILGHGALGVARVFAPRVRLGGLAVAAQVRGDEREALGQQRRHAVPGDVRPGMAVEEQQWRPVATVTNAERDLADLDALDLEALEHACRRRAQPPLGSCPGRLSP
jgi:hypothetical protein